MTIRRTTQMIAVSLFSTFLGTAASLAQDANPPWPVPDDAHNVANPVKSSPDGLAASAKLYHDNCLSCHGEEGMGDGPAAGNLSRTPFDFTNKAEMAKRTDGDLYFRMTKGRAPMPGWGAKLQDNDRWGLVNYLRTLVK